jgi:hypothetical protein
MMVDKKRISAGLLELLAARHPLMRHYVILNTQAKAEKSVEKGEKAQSLE